jgi:hypothetical protein
MLRDVDETRELRAGDAWTAHMRRGDFAAAWRVSDAMLAANAGSPCWDRPRHQQQVWDGTPLAGKRVLVRCYHGLGDTVQFIRFVPLLAAIASEVTVWAQAQLMPLLRTVPGIDRLIALHDGTPDVAYDTDVELFELMHIFRTTLATLPARVPYLHAVPAPRMHRDDLRDDLAVGLVWQAGEWDRWRSVPTQLASTMLGTIPGVSVHVLQHGPARLAWPRELGVLARAEPPDVLASVMQSLDLVISVDSFPAHLAGALAVPTWTLLPADADWRWMDGRDDSPWYPTMRLWRQSRAGEWEPVLARVAAALAEARCIPRSSRLRSAVSAAAGNSPSMPSR